MDFMVLIMYVPWSIKSGLLIKGDLHSMPYLQYAKDIIRLSIPHERSDLIG